MKRSLLTTAVLCAMALLMLLPCAALAESMDHGVYAMMNDSEWFQLRFTNEHRNSIGLDELTVFSPLQEAAQERSGELVSLFSHTRPDGSSCFTVMGEYGISYNSAAENIAYGYRSAYAVHEGWLNSTGHRANIENGALTHMGIGLVAADTFYWTQLFAMHSTCSYSGLEVVYHNDGWSCPVGSDISHLIDRSGLKVTCKKHGVCYLPISDYMLGSLDTSTPGRKPLKVSALGLTATGYVDVYADEQPTTVPVTGVWLYETSVEFTRIGDTTSLTVDVLPSDATNKAVTWSTSDPSVASVSSGGIVTAKGDGTCYITVTTADGGYSARCLITVDTGVPVTGVSLSANELELTVGDKFMLTAAVTPSNATDKSVTWSAGMPGVASVTSNGVVTAHAAGQSTVYVRTNDGGYTDSCRVTVKEASVPVEPVAPGIEDGWHKVGGKWYYADDGEYVKDMLYSCVGYKRGGGQGVNFYWFSEDGTLYSGFKKIDGEWYFFYEPAGSGSPKTTVSYQMVRGYYVEDPEQGYIAPSEQKVIDSGKERVYRYYFNEDGTMFTGWYRNDMSFDQTGRWRYFIEKGSSPMTSRLGRMCKYGLINADLCIGNNGENHSYFFSSTGGMFTGINSAGYFEQRGSDPETDLLGSMVERFQ